jgi:membrane protease YdiL (CAAX protease family)
MFLEKASRGKNNRWYTHVAVILLVLLALSIGSLPAALYNQYHPATGPLSPIALALLLLSYPVALAALLAGVKHLHGKRPADILSARPRFDLKRCLHAALAWGALLLLSSAIQYAVTPHPTLHFRLDPLPFLYTALVLVALLPFQVAWEESMFRGYLMQTFASLCNYRWMALAATSILFALAHASNPEVATFGFHAVMPQYLLTGLILGYVTIKDDGIELATGLHLANNLLAALLVTHDSSALRTPALFVDDAPSVTPADTLVTLACGILFIWICNARYHFISRNNLTGKIK